LTVLVTGGAGFIGSHVVKRLRREGQAVRVFDDLSTGSPSRLDPDVELVTGDVRSRDAVDAAMRGVDAVLHLAAMTSVARSWKQPTDVLDVNAQGTVNVVEAALGADAGTLVYSSSSSVYGDQAAPVKSEDQHPRPISPYGHSKLMGEQYALARGGGRLRVIALRYFNVFGPGQDPDSPYAAVIPRFIRHAIAGTTATIDGDGRQSRDFTFIDNVVEANLLALRATEGGVAVNVACGRAYTVLDLVQAVEGRCGCRLAITHGPPRSGDIRHSLADLSRAGRVLGYRPLVDFEAGVARTYESFRA
jgi:UDP-glucose 4-epimerase